MRSVPAWRLVLLAAAAGLALASAPNSVSQDRAPALPTELQTWLDDHGPIVVGVIEDGEPNTFRAEDGEVRGVGPETLGLGALRLGVNLTFSDPLPVPELVEALRSGSVDTIGAMAERPALVAFADPVYWLDVPVAFVTTDDHPEFTSLDELTGRTSTIEGSPLEQLLEERFPDLTYVPTGFPGNGVRALVDGEIDSYLGPLPSVGYQLIQLQQTGLRPVGDPVAVEPVSFWVSGDPELKQIIERIRAAVTDGELATITVKWTGFDLSPSPDDAGLPTWVWWVSLGVAIALVLALALVVLLRRRVAAATGELQSVNVELEQRVAERTEQLEQRTAQLERSNQELERFASVASHDLQEPLRMVSSYTELLSRRYGDELDDDAREFIDLAADGARRMQGLIADLLEYARLTTQAQTHVPVDLEEVVADVRRDLSSSIEEAGASVEVSGLPTVAGEPTQLRLLFQNLIGNAVKYRGEDPPRVRIGAELEGDGVWSFAVADNGIGVDDGFRDEVFEPFRRLHSRSEYPGTGMGLAICRRIVEQHGGRIWVEQGDPTGSVFRFTLRDEPAAGDEAAPVGAGERHTPG